MSFFAGLHKALEVERACLQGVSHEHSSDADHAQEHQEDTPCLADACVASDDASLDEVAEASVQHEVGAVEMLVEGSQVLALLEATRAAALLHERADPVVHLVEDLLVHPAGLRE